MLKNQEGKQKHIHKRFSFIKIIVFFCLLISIPLVSPKKAYAEDFGYNIYNLSKETPENIGKILDFVASRCGSNIVRLWGFPEYGVDGIGKVLNAAAGKNVRFIISLENYNKGDINSNATEWYKTGYKNSFRSYVQNTVSTFSGNGQILAWEIMNEAHCNTNTQECKDSLVNFMSDISSLIKSIDTDGTFVSAGMKAHPEAGDLDGTYQRITALPTITANSCHYYNTDGPEKQRCAEAKSIVKGQGKYFYVGEAGIEVSGCTTESCINACSADQLQGRVATINSDRASIGADAYLIWQFGIQQNGLLSCDPFTVFDNDPLCGGTGGPGLPRTPGPPGGSSPTPVRCRDEIRGLASPGWWNWNSNLPSYVKDAFGELQSKYTRVGLDWAQIETSQGVFEYNRPEAPYDTIVNTYLSNGVTPIGLFVAAPPWLDPTDSICQDRERKDANLYCDVNDETIFRNAVRNIVGHFSSIKYWEFWNEPEQYKNNLINPNEYQKWLNIFYDEVKAIDPNIKVAAGSDSANWFSPIAQTAKYDALVVHPYSGSSHEGPLDRSEVQQAASIIKGGATVWITEWGYNVDVINEDTQAAQLIQDLSWLNSQNYVEFAIFHLLADEGSTRYGLMKGDFLTEGLNGTKRRAYDAFKELFVCSYATVATCEQPLIANPEEGCFTCTFDQETQDSEERKSSAFSTICTFLGLETACSSLVNIGAALSWESTLNVTKLTSPVGDEMFTNWYQAMLPLTLPPDLAKNALDNEELALNTPSRVQIRGEQLSGGGNIQIQSGEGAIFNAVGQQFASAVMDCLFTGTPDDPACKNVQPTLASQMEYLANLPTQTTIAENTLPKTENSSAKESVNLDTLIASALGGRSSEELNKLKNGLRALIPEDTSQNESEGEVLASMITCPEKKDTPVKDPCLNQIIGKEAMSRGTDKQEQLNCKETTIYTPTPTPEDPNNQNSTDTEKCEPNLNLTNRIGVHPDFDFVTGSVGAQRAAFPANNHTFTSIFSLPGEEQGNLYPVIKKGYDSKVDFAVEKGASSEINGFSLIGDLIKLIAHFTVRFNEEEGANVPSGGERACREERTFNATLLPPGEAQDVPEECVTQMSPVDWGDFPLTCGTGIFDWTNANTETISGQSLASFGPVVGKIQGKIILTDGATKLLYGKDVPMNPGQIPANRCDYGPGNITLHRVELGSTSWANATIYKMSNYTGLNHIRFDLAVPPGIYAFEGDKGCWHYLNLPPISEAIVIENNTPQCFVLKENSNMPGGHSSDLGNPDNIVNYCGINYDTAYNSMCGGLDPGQVGNTCTKPAARCDFLRTIPNWPPGNGCSEMFPSTFQKVSCSSVTEPPVTLASLSISDISCTSENACFASAHTLDSSGEKDKAFLGSTTDGRNWIFKRATYMEGAINTALEAVPRIKFVNNTTGWLVGISEGDFRNVVLKTVDGGNTWLRQGTPGFSDAKNYTALDILASGVGAVGPSTQLKNVGIFYTADGGVGEPCPANADEWCDTWKTQTVSSSNTATSGNLATYNSALDIAIYGNNNLMIGANGFNIYNLTKTGATEWSATGSPVQNCYGSPSRIERVRMLSNSLGYAAGNKCPAKYEGGVWSKLAGFDEVSYLGLDATLSAQIFAAENGAVYILRGGGGNPIKISLPRASKLRSVEIVGNTVYVGGDKGKIYKSQDLGTTWIEITTIKLQP
ncbi:MAG: cellulase family glycosylhydrolase [bacterium]